MISLSLPARLPRTTILSTGQPLAPLPDGDPNLSGGAHAFARGRRSDHRCRHRRALRLVLREPQRPVDVSLLRAPLRRARSPSSSIQSAWPTLGATAGVGRSRLSKQQRQRLEHFGGGSAGSGAIDGPEAWAAESNESKEGLRPGHGRMTRAWGRRARVSHSPHGPLAALWR